MRLKVVMANVLSGEKHPFFGGGSPFSMTDVQTVFQYGKKYFYLFFDYGPNEYLWQAPSFTDFGGGIFMPLPITYEGHPAYIIDIKTPAFPADFVAAFDASKEVFVSIGVPIFTGLSEPGIPNYTVGSNTVANFWIFNDETGELLASYADGVDAAPVSTNLPQARDPLFGTYYPVNPWRKVKIGAAAKTIFWTNKVLCVED